jgi:hypothetical protein
MNGHCAPHPRNRNRQFRQFTLGLLVITALVLSFAIPHAAQDGSKGGYYYAYTQEVGSDGRSMHITRVSNPYYSHLDWNGMHNRLSRISVPGFHGDLSWNGPHASAQDTLNSIEGMKKTLHIASLGTFVVPNPLN